MDDKTQHLPLPIKSLTPQSPPIPIILLPLLCCHTASTDTATFGSSHNNPEKTDETAKENIINPCPSTDQHPHLLKHCASSSSSSSLTFFHFLSLSISQFPIRSTTTTESYTIWVFVFFVVCAKISDDWGTAYHHLLY